MIIQRLFSHTWENIKDKAERKKKAEELKAARQEINARLKEINERYKQDLRNAGLGLRNSKGEYTNSKKAESTYNNSMEDLNKYRDSIRDTKHRTPKKPKPTPPPPAPPKVIKSGFEEAIEKGKSILKKPGLKKAGYITVGAVGGTLAVDGAEKIIKKNKEKKKENEIRNKIVGGTKK
jgi:hypothetical protein